MRSLVKLSDVGSINRRNAVQAGLGKKYKMPSQK
jgi:hypothetical protein